MATEKRPDLSHLEINDPEVIKRYDTPCPICKRGPERTDENGQRYFIAKSDEFCAPCLQQRIDEVAS